MKKSLKKHAHLDRVYTGITDKFRTILKFARCLHERRIQNRTEFAKVPTVYAAGK